MKNNLYICGEIAGIDPPVTKRYQASFSSLFCLVLLNSLVMSTERRLFVHPGQRFGMLVAVKEIIKFRKRGSKERFIECICDCGNKTTLQIGSLVGKGAYANNCGCKTNELHSIHGMYKTRLYRIWHGIIDRCTNSERHEYKYYKGRGITICEEWLEFIPFMEWALSNGYADNLTIDRINNNGNYDPLNCKWVVRHFQSTNRRFPNKYVGVHYRADRKTWKATLTYYGKNVNIGTFKSKIEAAKARDRYVIANGLLEYKLNFPELCQLSLKLE